IRREPGFQRQPGLAPPFQSSLHDRYLAIAFIDQLGSGEQRLSIVLANYDQLLRRRKVADRIFEPSARGPDRAGGVPRAIVATRPHVQNGRYLVIVICILRVSDLGWIDKFNGLLQWGFVGDERSLMAAS